MAIPSNFTQSVLHAGASEEKGENARLASFVGAMAIADLVKSTLGPKGMDKILQSLSRGREVTVTNDGATILKSVYVDNPAAKVLVDISKTQDDEVGDGTTSVVVLAGELLREAEQLVAQKVHPMVIIAGFREAAEAARNRLLKIARDNKVDAIVFRQDLVNIAKTTLSSKILTQEKDHFAELAVDAVLRLKGSTNLDAIQIIKKPGGTIKDSFLDEGFILDKRIGVGQPKRIEDAKILVANTAMDTDKIKIYGARVRVDSMSKVADIEAAEKEKMKEKCEKIVGHGINCFVNRQLIYNFPEQLFADAGVMAIEHADFDGIERLALVTGGEIASTFDDPANVKLGRCAVIEEMMVGEDRMIHFSGCALNEACTIVLRGASHHVLDEAERSLHDALCVLSQTVQDSRVIYGGGWAEMQMARVVDDLAERTPGKRSLAMAAFARALRQIPTIICDNAGLDSAEIVSQMRAAHSANPDGTTAGVDVVTGGLGDMQQLGILEAFKVKHAALLSATEAAEMILRVDDIIKAAPRQPMREANRDEAQKCLEVAEAALARGDAEKAARFCMKAQKLFPTDQARVLLARIKRATSEPASSSGTSAGGSAATNGHAPRPGGGPSGMGNGPNLRQRNMPAAGASTSSQQQRHEPPDEDHKATPEQRELVRRIRLTTDYYEILSIQRGANDDEVKRAYRKLALKLHPDKNKARGADEAFKAVSKAFTCLSDAGKRRHYDAYGREETAGNLGPAGGGGGFRGGGGGFRGGGGGGGFYAGGVEIDPEELFNMFFGGNPFMGGGMYRAAGGGPPFARQRQHAHAHARGGGAQPSAAAPWVQLVQLAPLLLLLLFTFMSGRSAPAYSLQRTREYRTQLATATYEVPFWVRDAAAVAKDYPLGSRERVRLEQQVESDYRGALQQQCYNERMLQQRYHYYGRREEARRMELKSCGELTRRFGGRTGGGAAGAAGAGPAAAGAAGAAGGGAAGGGAAKAA
ncbi:T-complex 1 subunit beta [Micractinium conductrix]|uniref:CCT-beta n=1 Tax=Micractinium conductrix TaxID=554055 RepID=A0A2P6VK28_9CHLO|nr:T-complex 1 subunit beta [Micractinium conductrix]|eukprot:PSC74428.1 T-complex 1 subunit beta [Micractinium conductrix]